MERDTKPAGCIRPFAARSITESGIGCRSFPAFPCSVEAERDYRCIEHLLSSIIGHARILSLESDHVPNEMSRQIKAIADAAQRVSILFHRSCKTGSIPTGERSAEDSRPFNTMQEDAGASP